MQKNFLSPKDLALAIGVGESSIKRWADSGRIVVDRTNGGHRRISVANALRFIRQSGRTLRDRSLFGLKDNQLPIQATEEPENFIYEVLTRADAEAFSNYLTEYYLSGKSLAELFDNSLLTALQRVGELWEHDHDNGILLEHRAIDCCIQGLSRLRSYIPPPKTFALVAIGGAPENDPYILPSAMVATLLADSGYSVQNLGPNTPFSVLTQNAASNPKPNIIYISCSHAYKGNIYHDTADLCAIAERRDISIIVGGRGIPSDFRNRGPLHYCETMTNVNEFVRDFQTTKRRGLL